MPLTRYEIRNEYSIADPELYKVADKDDPEAILEGVAMAGLVGLLRQLGDLAEFAAEIFHDLHEEVMSTAARGHGLIVRVQQLEAEFPIIERKLLSQTRHTSFLYNSSVDWHPNLRLDQNTITQGDLPRFVMDSYEECRGPPRLFLLDKFDVAGAGACLKRFTDPSFFKTESASSTGSKFEIQREKKTRRVKKRGSRWRNGETPESFPSSHAKLHQLFLEERVESGGNDPNRRVKLKKRQFTGSLFDQENTKSYMEKFLDTGAPKQRIIHDSIDPLPLKWTSNNASGLEIVAIGVASPLKEPLEFGQRFSSSPDTGDIAEKPPSDESNGRNSEVCIDGEALEVLGLNDSNYVGKISSAITRVVNANDFGDRESKSGASIDAGCDSDDVASEIDNYEDALATIDSEVDTDSEWNRYQRYLRQPIVVDSDGSLEQSRLQGGYTDSQSVSNSATSEGGDNLFRERGSSSLCNSVISLSSEEITGNETEKHAMVHRADIKTNNVPKAGKEPGNISDTSYIRDTKIYSVDMDARLVENSLQMDEAYSNFSDNYIISRETQQGHPGTSSCLANQTVPELPEKADNGYCSSEYSTHEKSGHVSEFLQIESHNAYSVCSSIDKHTRDMEQPCNSDNKTPENIATVCVATEQGFTNPFSTQDFEKEFSIQEKHSETIHCAPSPDDIATLCPREDPSFEVASIPAEHENRISSAHTAVQAEKSSSIDNMLQDTAPKLSSSGDTEASEIVEGSSLENGEVGTDSSENIIIGEKFPGFSDKEIVLDSRKIDKPSSSLDLLKYEGGLHNLVSVINDQTNSGVISHLDDCQINAAALMGDSNKIEDESSAISNGTNLSESGVPCTRADEPGSVKVAENNSNFETHLENLEPVETIIDSSRPGNCKDDHDKKVNLLPSPVHPGMFQDQLLSVSEECNQNGDDLTKGHGSESTQNNLMDPVLDALVDPTLNLWNVSTDLSPSVLTSANSVQYVDAASSEHIHLPEVKDNYVDSSMHGLLKSLPPEKAVDISAPVTPFYEYGASHIPHNFAMDIQTPDFVERDKHWYAPAANNQYEPFVSKPLPISAEQRMEATTESSVRSMTIGDNHAFGPEMPLVYPPSDHRANEEPPPLPPLPPMQWRLGRLQNSSSAPDSRLVHQRPDQVQPTGLPGVHHTLEPAQTMSQTTALYAPARQHTFAAVASMDVPALVHQTVAIAPTSWNTGQPVTSDGNVALQGADILPRAPAACEGFAVPAAFGYMALEGGFGLPVQGTVSQGSSHDDQSFFAPSTSTEPHSASQITELFHQPYVTPPDSGSVNGIPIELNLEGLEATVNPDLGASIELPVSDKTEQEAVNSSVQSLPLSTDHQSSSGFVASQTEIAWLSSYNGSPTHVGGNTNGSVQKKLPRPRNPLIDEVVAIDKSKFRKVERVKPSLKKSEEREPILEQMQLRKVEKVKQPIETNSSEGGYVLEQLQLRKVENRVKPPIEPKSEECEFLPEQLQLKKVGERSKPEAGSKAEETDSPRVQLRKLSERVNQEIGARLEETGSPQVQLRKVSDKVKVKQEIEARTVELGPPRVQLRKVGDRVKQEIGATTEETESPRGLLRKVGEKTYSAVESKTEEKDSLFEQIRNKSFSLKPAVAARPNIQGPRTNLKVAAILEKASNIRQAMAGSDEEDDTDTWE